MSAPEEKPSHKVPADLWDKLKTLAREKRHDPTPTEAIIWKQLRQQQSHRFRFRRQHPIGQFMVDFYCSAAKVAIEIDGEIHQYTQDEDMIRQEYIESTGVVVVRFTTKQVLKQPILVVQQIIEVCQQRMV
jgi:very-short-patch-repair endonuclease